MAAHWLLRWGYRPQPGARPGARRWLGLSQGSQNAVEYGLIIATIALMLLIGGGVFGRILERWLDDIVTAATRLP